MAEDNCALNCNRTLKDASETQWHYDLDDKMPLPKNNKRARIKKKFLDIEAKVASDSEGKENNEDMDRFINNEDQDEEYPNTSIAQLTLQHSFYACLQNEDKKRHIMDHLCSGGGYLDWPLWSVAVKDGSEEDMVFFLSLHGGSKYICSTFSLSVIPGHIYVEAKCLDDIKTSIRILADVYQNSICAVLATTWDVSFSKIGEHYIPSKNT
ncbi:hypothetical protein BDQ17DRAFT_1333971 [Cyathus striatus]|nr:hypothetical protein BDQ17DRAFT_1333971 [Cyathus striatus]